MHVALWRHQSLPPNEAYLNWVSLLHRDIRMPSLSETMHEQRRGSSGRIRAAQVSVRV